MGARESVAKLNGEGFVELKRESQHTKTFCWTPYGGLIRGCVPERKSGRSAQDLVPWEQQKKNWEKTFTLSGGWAHAQKFSRQGLKKTQGAKGKRETWKDHNTQTRG